MHRELLLPATRDLSMSTDRVGESTNAGGFVSLDG